MRRRHYLFAFMAAVLGAPYGARAQQAPKVRIGWLSTAPHPLIQDFRQGMQELGYAAEHTAIDERYGDAATLPALAAELVRTKVGVIVTSGSLAGMAAKQSTSSIPIVAITGDPVGAGLVDSLARPGGNVTGLSMMTADIIVKWVELLRELVPQLSRIAILGDGTAASRAQWAGMEAAGPSFGVQLRHVEAPSAASIDRAFAAAVKERAGGIVLLPSPLFAAQAARIVRLAAEHRIPAMYEHGLFVEAGGLISYGPDLRQVFRRAAVYVDKIL